MSRDNIDGATCVADRLWVGSSMNSKDLKLLQSLGITHILNATAEEENFFENNFVYHRVPLYDRTSERSLPFSEDTISFISSAHGANGTVLIHCQEGISRSPTLALAYRMAKDHVPLGECFKQMRKLRPEIEPNRAFLQDLREWEAQHWGRVVTWEKLTRYDKDELDTTDPKEQLKRLVAACLVGDAKRIGEKDATKAQNAVCEAVVKVEPAELRSVLAEIICDSFENFGGTTVRDLDARENLATILQEIRHVKPCYSAAVLEVEASLSGSDRWKELCMDVPLAPYMLENLRSHSCLYRQEH
jgi:protein-tyrosine phosphatase